MGALEIVLLAAGAVIFTASFCIPVKREKLKEETLDLAADEVRTLVAEELESVRGKLTEISEEEMRQQIEKSERSMERISNEKIMAVNEYSDTVLDEIHKSHEEVVFLYDMMKNKKDSLTESYGKADQGLQELLQQVKDSEITVQESLLCRRLRRCLHLLCRRLRRCLHLLCRSLRCLLHLLCRLGSGFHLPCRLLGCRLQFHPLPLKLVQLP